MKGYRKLIVLEKTYWWRYPGGYNVELRDERKKTIIPLSALFPNKVWDCHPSCTLCRHDQDFSVTPGLIVNWILKCKGKPFTAAFMSGDHRAQTVIAMMMENPGIERR